LETYKIKDIMSKHLRKKEGVLRILDNFIDMPTVPGRSCK
jgi:hypothetical protein